MVAYSIPGFTVREVFHNLEQAGKSNGEIKIDEIPQHSTLRMKKGILSDIDDVAHENGPKSSPPKSLMQLTIGDYLIAYLLEDKNRREVAMMENAASFSSPIIFSNTGFEFKTKAKFLHSNSSHTLGILHQPKAKHVLQGVYLAFCEIDLQ